MKIGFLNEQDAGQAYAREVFHNIFEWSKNAQTWPKDAASEI